MKGRCTIILSYIESYTKDYIQTKTSEADYIICADGGEAIAANYGILPDCVIGDFDSDPLTEKQDCLYIRYPEEKDITDSEACLMHAAELGFKEISVIGGIGGRLDHTLGNILLLRKYSSLGIKLSFEDMKNSMTLVKNDKITLHRNDLYRYFAVVPIEPAVKGVSIRGAKYPLNGFDMTPDNTLGISNEIADDYVEIEVLDGAVLVTRSA